MNHVFLVGGNEFRPDCVPIDRELLRLASHAPARVLIVPTAAARERPELAVQTGVSHFTALGATASGLMAIRRVDWENDEPVGAVDDADIIYFTGGDPGYLVRTIRDTAVFEAIRQRCEAGAVLAGSSAGAMVLGAYLRERAGGWSEGLSVVPGVAVLPHFSPRSRPDPSYLRLGLPDDVVILGIAEATGCLMRSNGRWDVVGRGSVHVIVPNSISEYREGEGFQLPDRTQPRITGHLSAPREL